LKYKFTRSLRLPAAGTETFFLWGPRQTGKTTLQEYGVTEAHVERAFKTVRHEVRRARVAKTTRPFTGKL